MRSYWRSSFLLLILSCCCCLFACNDSSQPKKLINGFPLPEISLKDFQGKEIVLEDVRQDKLVLVEFWASWCKPCRDKHPELRKIYTEYKDKQFETANGFEIYYVNLDSEQSLWEKAVEEDGIQNWTHVADLKGMRKSLIPNQFQFEKIPTSFLIDTKGTIIGKDLSEHKLFYELKYRSLDYINKQ